MIQNYTSRDPPGHHQELSKQFQYFLLLFLHYFAYFAGFNIHIHSVKQNTYTSLDTFIDLRNYQIIRIFSMTFSKISKHLTDKSLSSYFIFIFSWTILRSCFLIQLRPSVSQRNKLFHQTCYYSYQISLGIARYNVSNFRLLVPDCRLQRAHSSPTTECCQCCLI